MGLYAMLRRSMLRGEQPSARDVLNITLTQTIMLKMLLLLLITL